MGLVSDNIRVHPIVPFITGQALFQVRGPTGVGLSLYQYSYGALQEIQIGDCCGMLDLYSTEHFFCFASLTESPISRFYFNQDDIC